MENQGYIPPAAVDIEPSSPDRTSCFSLPILGPSFSFFYFNSIIYIFKYSFNAIQHPLRLFPLF